MRKTVTRIAKVLWIVLVFAGAIAYIVSHFDAISQEFTRIALWRLGLAVLFLIGGKLLLVQLSRVSVSVFGATIPYRQMFTVNAMSQLAKYLPGGIWHFAGRAGYYHAAGLTPAQNTKAIILENIWLVSSAVAFGVAVFSLYSVGLLRGSIVAIGIILLVLVMMGAVLRWQDLPFHWAWVGRLLVVQTCTWLFIGLSFWVLFPSLGRVDGMLLAISAFALSWFVGYIAIFAPSGLGVRELVLTTLLGLVVPPDVALVYATINRLVWIITELLLAMIAQVAYRPRVDDLRP